MVRVTLQRGEKIITPERAGDRGWCYTTRRVCRPADVDITRASRESAFLSGRSRAKEEVARSPRSPVASCLAERREPKNKVVGLLKRPKGLRINLGN